MYGSYDASLCRIRSEIIKIVNILSILFHQSMAMTSRAPIINEKFPKSVILYSPGSPSVRI
jgi:hypothetical protein